MTMRPRSSQVTGCDFCSGGGGGSAAACRPRSSSKRGVLAGLRQVFGERPALVLGRGGAREPQARASSGRRRERASTGRCGTRAASRRTRARVDAAAVIRPEEHARAVRPVVQPVLDENQPPVRTKSGTPAKSGSFSQPCASIRARSSGRDRDVVLPAAGRAATAVPVLEHGQRADGEGHRTPSID